jgi:hypothetical protein
MSALGSLANALLDASRVADLNMHVGSYLLSGSDVRFGSEPAGRDRQEPARNGRSSSRCTLQR